jgi:hypothetical protein
VQTLQAFSIFGDSIAWTAGCSIRCHAFLVAPKRAAVSVRARLCFIGRAAMLSPTASAQSPLAFLAQEKISRLLAAGKHGSRSGRSVDDGRRIMTSGRAMCGRVLALFYRSTAISLFF